MYVTLNIPTLCAILYSTLLYSAQLCCTLLYSTALYCTLLYCTVLFCTLLHCTVLHCSVLHCTLQFWTLLYSIVVHCTELYTTSLFLIYLLFDWWCLLYPPTNRPCFILFPNENISGGPPYFRPDSRTDRHLLPYDEYAGQQRIILMQSSLYSLSTLDGG